VYKRRVNNGLLEVSKKVFEVESNEVLGLTKLLTEDFEKAVKSKLY
jgi:hypothetical protein